MRSSRLLLSGLFAGVINIFVIKAAVADSTADVTIHVETATFDVQAVSVCLWSDKQGFPMCNEQAPFHAEAVPVTVDNSRWIATFANIPSGDYAATAFGDVNGNGKLDRSFVGFPKEPIAISLEGKPQGRPAFEDAVRAIEGDYTFALRLMMPGRRGKP